MMVFRLSILSAFLIAGISAKSHDFEPSSSPSDVPSDMPSDAPSDNPSDAPSDVPSALPTIGRSSSKSKKKGKGKDKCKKKKGKGKGAPPPSNFNIQLDIPRVPDVDRPAFLAAQSRWEEVIIGDLPDQPSQGFPLDDLEPGCTPPTVIDDVYICGAVGPIDGDGNAVINIFARAGPLFFRMDASGQKTGLVAGGRMLFDEHDVPEMRQQGIYENTVLHEMGHVFGIGTLWYDLGLAGPDSTSANCQYSGANANSEWEKLTGCLEIPLEQDLDFPAGTRCVHWDEDCLGNELMTGFVEIDCPHWPLSRLTVATLSDLGYAVNFDAADEFGVADLDTNVCPLCTTRRGLREGSSTMTITRKLKGVKGERKPKLSPEAMEQVVAYGKSILAASNLVGEAPEGLVYVGDKVISVLVEQDGFLFDVLVTAF